MSSTINASTASGGGIVTAADASGILQLQTGGTTAVTIDASQNVGIGTSSPAGKLDVAGTLIAQNIFVGSSTASAGTIGASSVSGAAIAMYGSTASPSNTFTFNTPAGEQARIDNSGVKSRQIFAVGTNYNSESNIDVTPSATTFANGGFFDMATYSGMVVVNNYTSGGVSIWLCGQGVVSQVSSVGGGAGMSVSYNPGINGYTIQNNTGATVTIGIFKVRTRPGA